MTNILVNPGTTTAVATVDIGGGVESPRINLISATGGTLYGSAGTPAGGTTVLGVQGVAGGVAQPISGTVTLGAGTVAVGTTTALQGGTWTVQPGNTPNTAPWLVTLSSGTTAAIGAVTQSGTWTVQPGNTQNTIPWLVQPVSTATIGLNAGTNAIGTATALQGGTWTVGLSAGTNAVGTATALQGGTWNVGLSAGTNAVGTTTALQGTSPWVVGQGAGVPFGINVTQIGTTAVGSTVGLPTLIRDGAGNARFAAVNPSNQLSVSVDGGSLSASISSTATLGVNITQIGTTTVASTGLFTILRDASGAARGANVNPSNQLSVSVDGGTLNAQISSTATLGVNITQLGSATVTAALGLPTNLTTINGSTIAVGSGTMNSGTIRMALASDSPGAVTLGQVAMGSSVPVAIASDQGPLPLNIVQLGTTTVASTGLFSIIRDASGAARGANVNSSNQLSVSVDGGTLNAQISSTATIRTNLIQVGTSTINVGQALMAASLPVAIASNQQSILVQQTGTSTIGLNAGTNAIGTATALQGGTWTVGLSAGTNAIGTATALQGTSPWVVAPAIGVPLSTNITQVGTSTLNIGQQLMAASIPVAIASNQQSVLVQPTSTATVAATQSGTWTVQPGNTPNTSPWLVAPAAGVPFPVNVTQIGTTTIVTAGVAGTQAIGGSAATNVAIGTNPINLGAQAITVENTAVTATRMVQLVSDVTGKQIILPYANPENFVNGTAGAQSTGITNTAVTSLMPAPGAGLRNYVTSLLVTNGHATVSTVVVIGDGSVGTSMFHGYAVAAGGGFSMTFPTPLRQVTTNTALSVFCVTTGSAIWVSAQGYKGA